MLGILLIWVLYFICYFCWRYGLNGINCLLKFVIRYGWLWMLMVLIDINMSESVEGGWFIFGCFRFLFYFCKGFREVINLKGLVVEGLVVDF